MAETKPNGAVRPQSRNRQSATRSGVTHVKEFQPDWYTIIGNHLAQHRELSLTAIGLGTHILSLPEGASADIRSLAERFTEGRDRIAFALRELEAHGYIERVRERVDGGRVVTRTYAYNAPALTRAVEDVVVEEEPVEGDSGAVAPVVPPAAEAAAGAESSERGEHHDKAVALLVGLRRTDDRFTLSQKDVRRLAPTVAAWFDNGASAAAVYHAMTADLPVPLRNPARFLAYRLSELLPPPLRTWCRDCLAERERRTQWAVGRQDLNSPVPPALPEPSETAEPPVSAEPPVTAEPPVSAESDAGPTDPPGFPRSAA
ncbi:helix-turn-helix domain-containing protein [Streptomyces sp. SP18BB07]|uniref:helix-turn-helix domain-containing protein n=1 Tax=Streptomyces sp. SP18BB07 TaxID=3002522 RepID=UPI002E77F4A7|nr:helix-turn-helix domain-containing protein [Streptomyces sp. SP18BB07]MEE1758492.1 helix-turn-helix domain-containing protein [Streptomyces sp. SP18BB07]